MSHPLATPRRADVDVLRDLFIAGRELTKDEAWQRHRIGPRQFRAAVSALRLAGVPIVSSSSEGSVYRLARSASEAEEFVEREIVSRSRVLEQQARAIRDHSRAYFGAGEQLALIR